MSDNNTSFEKILDLVEGRLSETEAEHVVARIADDPAIGGAQEWITNFVSMSQQSVLQAPSASTRAALEDLLPLRPTVAEGVQRIVFYVAQLVRDVPMGQAFAGSRSAAIDAPRQLLFDVGSGADLMLHLDLSSDRVVISGQILGDEPAWHVRLEADDVSVELAADEFGEFSSRIAATAFLRIDLTSANQATTIDLTPFLDRRGADANVRATPPHEPSS